MNTTLTFTGWDRPGITAELLGSLGDSVEVRDIEQPWCKAGWCCRWPSTPKTWTPCAALPPSWVCSWTSRPECAAVVDRQAASAIAVLMSTALAAADVARIAGEIADRGGSIERIIRTAEYPVTAIEVTVSGVPASVLKQALGPISTQIGVMWLCSPRTSSGRRPPGRHGCGFHLIQDEVIDLLAREAGARQPSPTSRAGPWPASWTSPSPCVTGWRRFAGTPVSALATVRDAVRLDPGARTCARTSTRWATAWPWSPADSPRSSGHWPSRLGVHRFRANTLEVQDGRLTGRVVGPIVDRAGKAQALREFAEEFGFAASRTVAIGDGANDLDMLAAAGLGLPSAKPAVAAAADASVTAPLPGLRVVSAQDHPGTGGGADPLTAGVQCRIWTSPGQRFRWMVRSSRAQVNIRLTSQHRSALPTVARLSVSRVAIQQPLTLRPRLGRQRRIATTTKPGGSTPATSNVTRSDAASPTARTGDRRAGPGRMPQSGTVIMRR